MLCSIRNLDRVLYKDIIYYNIGLVRGVILRELSEFATLLCKKTLGLEPYRGGGRG
jgi:hypothetical protein